MSEFNRHLDDSRFRQRYSAGRLDRVKAQAFPVANFCLFLLIALALAVAPTAARSQELEGTFTGTVTDTTGALIPHATVTITLNGSGASRVVETDDQGSFTAANLPAGTYTVQVKAPHFEAFSDQNVVLNVAQRRAVNATLKPGSENQTVEVQDNPVAIETTSSSQAGTIDGTQVRELEPSIETSSS